MLPKCHLENYFNLLLGVDLDEYSPIFWNTTDIFSIMFELEMHSLVK